MDDTNRFLSTSVALVAFDKIDAEADDRFDRAKTAQDVTQIERDLRQAWRTVLVAFAHDTREVNDLDDVLGLTSPRAQSWIRRVVAKARS